MLHLCKVSVLIIKQLKNLKSWIPCAPIYWTFSISLASEEQHKATVSAAKFKHCVLYLAVFRKERFSCKHNSLVRMMCVVIVRFCRPSYNLSTKDLW